MLRFGVAYFVQFCMNLIVVNENTVSKKLSQFATFLKIVLLGLEPKPSYLEPHRVNDPALALNP
jgi:hypothetical protein